MKNKFFNMPYGKSGNTPLVLRNIFLLFAFLLTSSKSLFAVEANFTKAFKGEGSAYVVESSSININAPFSASNFKFTSLNAADALFSGNNVEGYFSYLSGATTVTLRGIISRKVGSSSPEAFYIAIVDNLSVPTGEAFLLIAPGNESLYPGTSLLTQQVNSAPIDAALNSILPTAGPLITGPNNAQGANSQITVTENTIPVFTFAANKAVNWSFSGAADRSKFKINSTTGAVEFLVAPNYESPGDTDANNSYVVTVTATDGSNVSSSQTLTVYVTNLNDAPTNISLSPSSIYENNLVGANIGNLSTTDPDAGDTFTYSLILVTGDEAAFTISGNTLKAAQSYKFDTKNSYNITIKTTDASGLSFEKAFIITILKAPVATATGNIPGTNTLTPPSSNATISRGFSSQLNVTGSNLVSYSWSPSTGLSATNIANPVARPSQTTVYAVTVTNSSGISTTVYVTVNVVRDYNFTPSNVVTANGDGINDVWVIHNLESYPDHQIQLYDKAGRLLYQSTNYQNNWGGTVNGYLLNEGTYYYYIKIGANEYVKRGYISIIPN